MKSLLFELYKNIDIPSTPVYELILSADNTSVYTNDDLRNAKWDVRQDAIKNSTIQTLISKFGLTADEVKAMIQQRVVSTVSEEWLNDPTAYRCSSFLKKGEKLEDNVEIAKQNAKIAKAAWKRILNSNNSRIKPVDKAEGSWFDPTAKQYEWSSDLGVLTNKWSNGYKLVGTEVSNDENSRIVVDTENKTIDFGAFEREYSNRRPRQFSGKKGTLTIPSGGTGLRGKQQNMKKIMGFLIKNDPRVDKTYKIQGVLEWANLTLNDVMYDKEEGHKGVQPVNQRVVQDIQGMNVGGSYLFHGTSEYRWKEIQRLGFMRGGAPSREGYQYVDLKPGWSEGNIYLTDTIEDAENYASRQFDKDGTKAVVLRVKIPDPSKLVIDEDNKRMLDNRKFANMIREAGVPFRIEVEGRDLKLTYIPEESDPEFKEYASYITQRFSKEEYIESAVNRSGALQRKSGKQDGLSPGWIESKVNEELGWNTPEANAFSQKIFGFKEGSRRDDWAIDWRNDENPEQIRLLIQVATEEGYGDVVQRAVDAFPKYPAYLQTRDAFIEHITPWAEQWETIARSIWTDKQAAIRGFKAKGTIAYQGEIPADNVEVVMAYKPNTMKDDPEEKEYNKAMDATRDTLVNRYSLERQWKDMKKNDPKAKPTKDMKAWEKSYGYKFEGKYSLLKNIFQSK